MLPNCVKQEIFIVSAHLLKLKKKKKKKNQNNKYRAVNKINSFTASL